MPTILLPRLGGYVGTLLLERVRESIREAVYLFLADERVAESLV